MHLRDYVNNDDVDLAISVMLQSFIQSQKYSVARIITKKFSHYIKFREENNVLLKQILDKLMTEKVTNLLKNSCIHHLIRSKCSPETEIKLLKSRFVFKISLNLPMKSTLMTYRKKFVLKQIKLTVINSDFLKSETFSKNFTLRDTDIVKVI